MHEHLIRLRGGWERYDPAAPGGVATARPVTLPLVWPPDAPARVRLVRSFRSPEIDPRAEALELWLDDVAGVVVVDLNGQTLARPGVGTPSLWLPLTGPLPSRNRLTLDVEHPPAGGPWGRVALVIQRREPGEP
jgi:hypothetical protein